MALRVTRQYDEILAAGDGDARVTRQYTEILAKGAGSIRATRQYAEILAESFVTYEESVQSNLSLAQQVNVSGTFSRSVEHPLGLSQKVSSFFFLDCENTLNLTQKVSPTYFASVTSNMSLVQDVFDTHIPSDFIPIADTMNLQQTVVWDVGLFKAIIHDMQLSQNVVWQGPHYFNINQYLTSLEQTVENTYGCPWLPVELEDELNLAQNINRTYEETINQTVNLVQDAWKRDMAESTINFNQSITWGKSKGLPVTNLSLSSIVNVNGDFGRTAQHTAILGHALTYYLDRPCDNKNYTPFVGTSTVSSTPAPPPSIIPIIQNDPTVTRFKLAYPGIGEPTDTIILRAPELDNIDRYAFSRINRETRGGKLSIFVDPNWPQINTLIANFIGLKKTEIDEILTFLHNYVGEEVHITDWEGREWVGVIITPNESATQDGRDNWSFTFEFEGVLIESHTQGTTMNLSDTLNLKVHWHRSLTHTINMIQTAVFLVV
jgi:hypothetical protein